MWKFLGSTEKGVISIRGAAVSSRKFHFMRNSHGSQFLFFSLEAQLPLISKRKVKNLKITRFFSKKYAPPLGFFLAASQLTGLCQSASSQDILYLESPRHLSATVFIFSKYIPFTLKCFLSSQYFEIRFIQGSLVIATTPDNCQGLRNKRF